MALHSNKTSILFTQVSFEPSLVEIGPVVLEKEMIMRAVYATTAPTSEMATDQRDKFLIEYISHRSSAQVSYKVSE